ncbi:CYtochrome P450 family [Aphelenchoides besseyi]|nr:CYtochrome P450 family [Aphelenchoides besseyi]KAI6200712.1 CYtochrome P450 family [Aphelenchoides besseyi]
MLFEFFLAVLLILLVSQLPKLLAIFRSVYLCWNIPGPECLPLIGCLHVMPFDLKELPNFMHKCANDAVFKGAHLMKFWVGPRLVCLPLDHEALKPILNNTTEISKGRDYKYFEQWLGPGLLLGDGERWHRSRKFLTPAFHFSKIEEYLQTMDMHAKVLVELLNEKANGSTVDVYNYIKHCALDIIADTTMGVQLNAQRCPEQPYVCAVEKFNYAMCHRSLHPELSSDFIWRWTSYRKEADAAVEVLHSFSKNVIKERMEIFEDDQKNADPSVKKRPNFLDLMLQLQDSEQMSKEQIHEEVNTFMFAGHDTTAHALSWFFWAMATNSEIQEKLYEEIIEHFGHSDTEFGTNRVKELKYLDQCFKESLRLFTPVPAIARNIKNEMKVGDQIIPAGSSLTIPLILIHRNPRTFENPMRFDPSRFEEEKTIPPYAFSPFSAGLRNCIGQKFAIMESKIIICQVLYNFKLESDLKLEDNKVIFEVVLRPSLGVPVRLVKREH